MSRNAVFGIFALLFIAAGMYVYTLFLYRTPVIFDPLQSPELVFGTAHADDIPSIDTPRFESVASADVYLNDAGYGIVVEIDGRVRFYPFQILVWHQVVNDRLNEKDILVTFDPLTSTVAVYERDDVFGVSGQLWNSNTILYDRSTTSLWSQLRGDVIQGPRSGAKLMRYPATVLLWSTFKKEYPYGDVLSRQTGFDRDYTRDPYDQYARSKASWFPLDEEDVRLPPKSLVFGLNRERGQIVFPVDSFEQFDVVQSLVKEGEVLVPSYWFAWAAVYPDSQIYPLIQ